MEYTTTLLLAIIGLAFLGVVAIPLYWIVYWMLGFGQVFEKYEAMQQHLPEKELESISRQLYSAVILGGIVGGIAFALVNPLVSPAISDFQVEQGFVDEPDLSVDMRYRTVYNDNESKYTFGKSWESDYTVQTITIKNTGERLASSVNILLVFSGCIESRRSGPFSFADPSSVTSQVEYEYSIEEINQYEICSDSIYVDSLSDGKTVEVQYLIDKKPETDARVRPIGTFSYWTLSEDEVRISSHYVWSFNGREYDESPHTRAKINGTLVRQ